MFDETTHCSVTEQLAIHGCYIESSTGELKSHYLKVIDTLQPEIRASTSETSADTISLCAQTITNRVCEYVASAELDMEKMRGIGASTMMGCRNGVSNYCTFKVNGANSYRCTLCGTQTQFTQFSFVTCWRCCSLCQKFSCILRQLYDCGSRSSSPF
jgi:hypothetical protein